MSTVPAKRLDPDSVCLAIVEAIAEAERIDPLDLGYSLGDHVDTDAIEAMTAHRGGEWVLQFWVPDHTITVDSDGFVTVDGQR